MLIEQRLRAFAAMLLLRGLRLSAAKTRTIGVGLLRSRFLCGALPESIQIDDITHARLHHAKTAGKERQCRRRRTDSIAIQNPRMPSLKPSITEFRYAKTNLLCSSTGVRDGNS